MFNTLYRWLAGRRTTASIMQGFTSKVDELREHAVEKTKEAERLRTQAEQINLHANEATQEQIDATVMANRLSALFE